MPRTRAATSIIPAVVFRLQLMSLLQGCENVLAQSITRLSLSDAVTYRARRLPASDPDDARSARVGVVTGAGGTGGTRVRVVVNSRAAVSAGVGVVTRSRRGPPPRVRVVARCSPVGPPGVRVVGSSRPVILRPGGSAAGKPDRQGQQHGNADPNHGHSPSFLHSTPGQISQTVGPEGSFGR